MTPEESAASTHYDITQQFGERINRDGVDDQPDIIRKRISKDPKALVLLEGGIQQFIINTTERIFKDSADEIYFNNCPKCGKLARTPQAKQCRYCSYSWHDPVDQEVGKFKIAGAFQIIDGPFYIVGDVVSGNVNKGMKINLTDFGLIIKPVINGVESIAYRGDGNPRQAIALMLSIKSAEDKEFLKSKSPFNQSATFEK
jgi:hypothetical protein